MTDPAPHDPTEETLRRPESAPAPWSPPGQAEATLLRSEAPATPGTEASPAGRRFGRYQLLEELGRGGMGVVWKAQDTELRRTVALKLIRADRDTHPEQVARFVREARLAAKLSHPGIVPVFDIGEVDGQHYFTSEFVPGHSLAEETSRPADPRKAAEWVKAIAEALAYAHAHGVVHRDVKPCNVLLDAQDRPRLTDFGLAKGVEINCDDGARLSRLTLTGEVMGTPSYMSPELARGDASCAGPASDQFSLGVVLYQLLTGRLPFERAGLVEILRAILEDDAVPPSQITPTPADLETICLKALEKDPARRYPSTGDFAADLGRWLGGEPVAARPASLIRRLARRVRRNRVLAASIASAAVAALAIGGKLAHDWRDRAAKVRDAVEEAFRWEDRGDRAPAEALDERTGAYRKARDAALAALRVDEGSVDARKIEGRVSRRIAEVDAARSAATEREALRKGNLVHNVLMRWVLLTPAIQRIEGIWSDTALRPEQRESAYAAAWVDVQQFMDETPGDPASQATMWPLAGLAKALAGETEEGQAWMRKGGEIDPDLPFGALMQAVILFTDYMHLRLIPPLRIDGNGVRFERPPEEGAALRETRGRVESVLEEAGRARVWGKERALETQALLDAIRLFNDGDMAGAEAALCRAHASPALRAIETIILYLRAYARYMLANLEGAWQDMESVCSVRKNHAEMWYIRSMIGFGRAEAAAALDGESVELLRTALADADRAVSLAPAEPRCRFVRGQVLASLAEAELAEAIDPRPRARQALEDLQNAEAAGAFLWTILNVRSLAWCLIGRAEALDGMDATGSLTKAAESVRAAQRSRAGNPALDVNLGNVLLELADAEARKELDPRERFRAAVACFDVAINENADDGDAYFCRANAYFKLGAAEEFRKQDPLPCYQRALLDYDLAAALVRLPWKPMINKADLLWATGRREDALALMDEAAARCDSERQKGRIRERRESLARRLSAAWVATAQKAYEAVERGDYAAARGMYEGALADAGEAAEKDPTFTTPLWMAHHDLACIYALLSDGREAPDSRRQEPTHEDAARHRETAFRHLSKAIDLGWDDAEAMREDPDFAPIRSDPRFAELLGRVER